MITPKQFSESVQRTWNRENMSKKDRLANAALGLTGEAGEVGDLVKKCLFHSEDSAQALVDNREKLIKELGDTLFYVFATLFELELTFEEVAEGNKKKLEARFPSGFSCKDAQEKKDQS